eukprot:6833677-Pyramimonas_sp.AAC.1
MKVCFAFRLYVCCEGQSCTQSCARARQCAHSGPECARPGFERRTWLSWSVWSPAAATMGAICSPDLDRQWSRVRQTWL